MNLLSSVENVRNRLSYDDAPNINNALQASLQSATTQMSTLLRTPFDLHTYQDIFGLRAMVQMAESPALFMKLKAGFLTNSPVSVYWSTNVHDLLNGSGNAVPETGLSLLGGWDLMLIGLYDATGSVVVNTDKGVAAVYNNNLRYKFLSVQYTAGFEVDGENIYENLPDWLTDAAESYSIILLDQHYPQFRGDRSGDPASIKARKLELASSIQQYVRYIPNGEMPISTIVIS